MKAMTQSSHDPSDTPPRGADRHNRWDIASLAIGLFTIVLAFVMSTQPGLIPTMPDGPGANDWNVLTGIVFYAFLFAALSLLSYRLSYGLYSGFHHVAVVAAYLTFGPAGALAVAFIGRTLCEVGRMLFYKQLELRPHTLRQAIVSVFFHAGAHGTATLARGFRRGSTRKPSRLSTPPRRRAIQMSGARAATGSARPTRMSAG